MEIMESLDPMAHIWSVNLQMNPLWLHRLGVIQAVFFWLDWLDLDGGPIPSKRKMGAFASNWFFHGNSGKW